MVLVGSLAATARSQDDAGGGEVQLSIVSFGVGGLSREGEWTGVQVQMQDLGTSGRDVVLRIEIKDEDGDLTQYDRVVTANPGALQSFWLYCWLPYRSIGAQYELKAFEAIDTGNDEVGQFGFRAGRLLGTIPIYNPQTQPPTLALTAVVGEHQLGLDQYGYTTSGRDWMLFGHELMRTSPGLGVDNLPDRWQGLVGFDSMVWSTATRAQFDPGRLTPEKARAIRTWVERGGHLVVVLQSSGDPWYLGNHPLRSILPEIKPPQRHEGVSLEPYRTLLTESDRVQLPDNAVVYSFEPLDGGAQRDATPVLNGPDGACVVIRRLVGSGMVTVVGLPLNHGELRRVGLPDPEAFWHRVLGLRGDILRPDQMSDQQKSDVGNRIGLSFDDGLSGSISKTGTAVQGVMFGIVVFVLYWLVAGPVGFAMLRAKKLKQHAWVAFVASIAAFTAIAWLGATALRPKSVNISHLTLLEQVHGQDTQRARTWFSAMLPTYGTAVVSMVDPELDRGFGGAESSDLIIPWANPDASGVLTTGFPDNSGYRVESKNPSAVRVPTRATIKSFYAEWSGAPGWSMPAPVGTPGDLEEPELSVSGLVVSGQVAHNLPGALTDVRVFVISREAPINRPGQNLGRRMIAQASVYAPDFGPDGWKPGTTVDMEDITRVGGAGRAALRGDYFSNAVRLGVDTSGLTGSKGSLVDRLIAGMFISQFEPPRFGAATSDPVGTRLARRRALHGWDMGRWFTQPTLIIVGVLQIDGADADPDAMPEPVWINSRRVPASGTTIVTWVYPFEASPPTYLGDIGSDPGEDTPQGAEPLDSAGEGGE